MQSEVEILLHAMEHEADILSRLGDDVHAKDLADEANQIRILFTLGLASLGSLSEADSRTTDADVAAFQIPTGSVTTKGSSSTQVSL